MATDIIKAVSEDRIRIGDVIELTPNDNLGKAWSNADVGAVMTVSNGSMFVKLKIEHLERSVSGVSTAFRARVIKIGLGWDVD